VAQQQVLGREVLAWANPSEGRREQQPNELQHVFSIADLWRARFAGPHPGDKRGGRYTSSVRSIELKDLAPAQRDAIRVQLLVADGDARIASLSGRGAWHTSGLGLAANEQRSSLQTANALARAGACRATRSRE
jgi:hypothetical protein